MKTIVSKKILSVLTLIALATLTMANQKCEEEAPKVRTLKKNVQILGMEASTFLDNSGFNFSEVAQNQLSGVIFETETMFERNVYPKPESSDTQSSAVGLQKMSIDSKQMSQLKTWFPEMKTSDAQFSKNSSCLVSRPQHFLYGKINSLEA
jgi:hypothetical protein